MKRIRKAIHYYRNHRKPVIFISLVVIAVLLPIAFLLARYARNSHAAWNDVNYGYRKPIVITNNGSTQTNYVVEVTMDTQSLQTSKMQADCDDVRFTSSDGTTDLDFFTDYCSTTASVNSSFFVEVPTITGSGATTTLYVYYGYASATSASSFSRTAAATTDGSVNTTPPGVWMGTGWDGSVSLSNGTSNNINTGDLGSATRSCANGGDAVMYKSTASTAQDATTITLSSSPASGCINSGDQLLIISLRANTTSDSNTNVGKYEFIRATANITTTSLTINRGLLNAYDGTIHKILIQRVPNYTTVALSTASTSLVPSAWDGTTNFTGGVLAFRANSTVTVASSTSIHANSLGYAGGTGATAIGGGGSSGESYDSTIAASGQTQGGAAPTRGGGEEGAGTTGAPGVVATTGAGGGGGGAGSLDNTTGGGGAGGGGGYGIGGGGGGSNSDDSSPPGGTGGAGGLVNAATSTSAGGGAGACLDTAGAASNGNAGGAGGSAGTSATCNASGNGGAAGSGTTQGGGGGGVASTNATGAGGGGGGNYGAAALSTLYFGSGGGGGGGGDGGADGTTGGIGGGIVYINASEVSVSGSITSTGANSTAAAATGGNGGGGAGGSVLIRTKTDTGTWTSAVTALGGNGGGAGTNIADGGDGGNGRMHFDYTDTGAPGSGSPTADTSQVPSIASPGTEEAQPVTVTAAVSNWKFDEGYGTTTTSESVANNNTGTLAGTTKPTWQTEDMCVAGKCLFFDGSTSKITLAHGEVFKSISMWVRPNTVTVAGALYSSDTDAELLSYNSSGVLSTTGMGTTTIYINGKSCSTCTLVANQWQHVAVTTSTSNTSDDPVFGASASTFFKGFMDEVRMSSGTWSASEVQGQFTARGSAKGVSAQFGDTQNYLSDGLVAYYKLDEATSGGITDSSGNSISDLLDSFTTTSLLSLYLIQGGTTSNNRRAQGQSFTTTSSYSTTTVDLYLAKSGSPVDNLTLEILSSSMTGTVLGTSATVGGASVSTSNSWIRFTFASPVTLSSGTTYYLRLTRSGANDVSNYYQWNGTGDEYAGGNRYQLDLASWVSASSDDLEFKVFASNYTGAASGKFGPSASFNGSDQVIRIPESTSTDLGATTDSYTVSAWFKTSSSNTQTMVAKNGGSSLVPFQLATSGGFVQFFIQDNVSNPEADTTQSYNDGNWHLATGVRDRQSKKLLIYVDGVYKISTDDSSTVTIANNDNISIGNSGASYITTDFTGSIDDVRIYNRALSGAEVAKLYEWAPSPVAHWKMDENTGTTLQDSSGNANASTTWTGDTKYVSGKFGSGLSFDGTNDVVQINPTLTSLDNIGGTTDSYTVEAWFKTSADYISQNGMIVGKRATPSSAFPFSLSLNGSNRVIFSVSDGTNSASSFSPNAFNDGLWHHAVGIRNTGVSPNTTSVYVDGVLVDADSDAFTLTATSTSDDISIGNGSTSYNSLDFNGQIDDVRIYNYTRSPKQIVSDMNAGHPAVGSPVGSALGYWKFDEGNGTSAKNSGSQGSTLVGGFYGIASPATSISGWTNNGKFGKGLIFDGTTGSCTSRCDDMIGLGSASVIDDLPATGMSISAWIKPVTMGTSSQGVIMSKSLGNTVDTGWILQFAGTNALKFSVDGSTNLVRQSSNNVITMGSWNHIVIAWDGVITTASSVHIYINGKEVSYATTTNGAARVSDASSELSIGNDGDGTRAIDGTLDEVKLYNYALSSSEILVEYNGGKGQTLGALSTDESGNPSNASTDAYCPPGNAETNCASGRSSSSPAPILEWKLDENTGTAANDTSGNGLSGTLTNSPTWTTGKKGSGVSFAGSDQHILRADDSNLDFISSDSFAIETWFKHTTASAQEVILSKYAAAGYKIIMESDGDITCGLDYDSTWTPTDFATSTAATYDDGNWHHIACVKNGSTDLKLYIDGQLIITDSSLTASTLDNADPLYYGIDDNGTSNDFTGSLDNLLIYRYNRTQPQVAWDYNRGGPVGWWKFDECTGPTANDASGFGNTGTLTGTGSTNTSNGDCTTVLSSAKWYNGRNGKFNASLDFDGGDDYVTMGDPGSGILDVGTTSFTISAWIKTTSNGTTIYIIDKKDDYPSNTAGYVLALSQGRPAFGVANGTSNASSFTSTTVKDGLWHLVTVVMNRPTDIASLYIDGKLNTTWDLSNPGGNFNSSQPFEIGRQNSNINYFPGQIDDVRIYNYALSPQQIKLLYNENSAVRFAPLTGSPQ